MVRQVRQVHQKLTHHKVVGGVVHKMPEDLLKVPKIPKDCPWEHTTKAWPWLKALAVA